MYTVTKYIDFCYGHRLLNYDGKCRHLHGHNGRVEISIRGEALDERGMVMDFGEIKSVMKGWIDENLDHRMILHRDDPSAEYLISRGEPLFLTDDNPTAECIARLIYEHGRGAGLPIHSVVLWEAPDSFATYGPVADAN